MSLDTYIQLVIDMSPEFFEAFLFWEETPPSRRARPDHWGMFCAGHEL